MKIVPVIKVRDLETFLDFYTRILDFERKWPGYEALEVAKGVIDLIKDGPSCSSPVTPATESSVP